MDGLGSGGCPNHDFGCDCLLDGLDVLLSHNLEHISLIEYDFLPRVLEYIEAVALYDLIHELFNQCERYHRCLNFITCILRGNGVPTHEVLIFTVVMLVAFPSS
jgi:hypothetical protein